jgi:copper chaperone NosL
MMVSDPATAAQIVASGEEPLFFDDIGCLAKWLARRPLAPNAIVYVADHRTKIWVVASRAVFTRAPGARTPMGSQLIAHESADSLARDPEATQGEAVSAQEILGSSPIPDTRRPS